MKIWNILKLLFTFGPNKSKEPLDRWAKTERQRQLYYIQLQEDFDQRIQESKQGRVKAYARMLGPNHDQDVKNYAKKLGIKFKK
jgi:hypothetical protein